MKSEKIYVNFYAPKDLVEDFDEAIEGKYNSRTDAILDLMRKFMERNGKRGDSPETAQRENMISSKSKQAKEPVQGVGLRENKDKEVS